jgi:hypothetical protein
MKGEIAVLPLFRMYDVHVCKAWEFVCGVFQGSKPGRIHIGKGAIVFDALNQVVGVFEDGFVMYGMHHKIFSVGIFPIGILADYGLSGNIIDLVVTFFIIIERSEK